MTESRPDRVARAASHRESVPSRPHTGTAGFRLVVLASIVVGVLVGAMACAAGLSAGDHGSVHAVATADGPSVDGAHHPHHAHVPVGAEAAAAAPIPVHGDGVSTVEQSHPGMACVVAVDLRFPDPVVRSSTGTVAHEAVSSPADCPPELDPPVPRSS